MATNLTHFLLISFLHVLLTYICSTTNYSGDQPSMFDTVKDNNNHDSESGYSSDGELLKVIYVTRHGMRAPYSKLAYPGWQLDQKIWPNGEGMLTDDGIMDMYTAGNQARERYVNLLNLGDKSELGEDSITVASSDSPRTISTAKAIIAGLTHKKWSAELLEDIKDCQQFSYVVKGVPDLLFETADLCLNHQKAILKNIYGSGKIQKYLKKYGGTFSSVLKRLYGDDISNLTLREYIQVQDPLYCLAKLKGKSTLPKFALKDHAYKRFDNLINMMFVRAVKGDRMLQRSIVGLLINQMVATLEETVKESISDRMRLSPNNRPFHLYSAHSHTLGALMTAFNTSYHTRPEWGSALIIELWVDYVRSETGVEDKVYTVNFLGKIHSTAPVTFIKSQRLGDLLLAVKDVRATDVNKMILNCVPNRD